MFTIYRVPPGMKKLKIEGVVDLYFGGPGQEDCNAILVDDHELYREKFQVWARKVDENGKDRGGPTGALEIPMCYHDTFIEELKSNGFVPCYRNIGSKGYIINTSSSAGTRS